MTTAIRSLLTATAAAALLAAPAARAHDRDGDEHGAPPASAWAPPAWAPPQPPAFREPPPPPLPALRVRPGAWFPRGAGAAWELRVDYARLAQARQRFYARWQGNPWTQRRFEGWYAVRRAELDRRAAWLTQTAAWPGPRGNAWGWRHGDRDDD